MWRRWTCPGVMNRAITALVVGLTVAVAAPSILPWGFTETTVAAGFNYPTVMAFLPDGQMSPPDQSHRRLPSFSTSLIPKAQPPETSKAPMRPFFVRLCLFLAAAGIATAQSTTKLALPHAREPKYPATKKCDPSRCICTPEAYIEAFLETPNLSGNETTNPDLATAVISGPVCVGENLVARINGRGIPPLTPTLSALDRKIHMVFVFDNIGLEKVLTLGQYRAKQILSLIGFGAIGTITCKSPGDQTLVVLQVDEPSVPGGCRRKSSTDVYSNIANECNKGTSMSAIWDNSLPFLEQVFKTDLSKFEPAMDIIKTTRFEDLTGCRIANISALNFLQLINSTFLKAAGCSDAFATAMVQFGTTPCKKPSIVEMNQNAAKYLYYTEGRNGRKTNYCDADILFQQLDPSSPGIAQQIRAYFYITQNCNAFYGGYGYTANDYGQTQVPERWINNQLYAKTTWASTGLDCSLSSDPAEIMALGQAEFGSDFVPYMAGF